MQNDILAWTCSPVDLRPASCKSAAVREAKLRLVIKTDIKDISSVGQSPKRVTLGQGTNFKCVGYG